LLNIDPSTAGPVFEGGVKDRRSELALSEVEGVNPEHVEGLTIFGFKCILVL